MKKLAYILPVLGILAVILSLGTYTAFASVSIGPNNPGTLADDSSVGNSAWTNPGNAAASDNVYVTSGNAFNGSVQDNIVSIVKSNGTIGSENKAIAGNWPTSDTYSSYGSSSDLWSETWSYSDINDVDFGVVISSKKTLSITHYLKATNFGFTIPSNATIDGILAEIEKKNSGSELGIANVDHIRITVYYTTISNAQLQVQSGTLQVKSGKLQVLN